MTNTLQSNIEQELFRKKFRTICTFHFVPVWPIYGVTGSAPRIYLYRYLENSKKFLNSWWTWNVQNHRTVLLISSRRAGPLNKGSRRVQSVWRISFKTLAILWKFVERKCSSQRSGCSHIDLGYMLRECT